MTSRKSLLACLIPGLLLGCDADAPDERLAAARAKLDEVRDEVQEFQGRVEEKREGVRRAEEALANARRELDEAEGDLAQVRAKIDERATDIALFRAIQSKLLDRSEIEEFAIRAEVKGGVVTLRGEVDAPAQRELALETARSVVGVDGVVNEIQVREPTG